MFLDRADRPDKHTARTAWERSWDEDLKNFYSLPLSLMPRMSRDTLDASLLAALTSESHLLLNSQQYREICDLQADLARATIKATVDKDFETAWKALTVTRRREIVLEGIYRASCVAWLETARDLCPEITLRLLSSDDENGYLSLLKKFLPATPPPAEGPLPELIQISHPVIEHIWLSRSGDDAELKSCVNHAMLNRTYFMSMSLWQIFLAFHGEEEKYVVGKAPRPSTEEKESFDAAAKAALGKKVYRDIVSQDRRERPECHSACWQCGKTAQALTGEQRLKACSKCQAVGRKIMYCSRKCQVKNWAAGLPKPHKNICGKPLDIEANDPPAPIPSSRPKALFPDPAPGFKRSPALLHQISLLMKYPEDDYVLVFPSPKPDLGITFGPREDKLQFLQLRHEAFRYGEPQAVRFMFCMLASRAIDAGVSLQQLKDQLDREYGVSIDLTNPAGDYGRAPAGNSAGPGTSSTHTGGAK